MQDGSDLKCPDAIFPGTFGISNHSTTINYVICFFVLMCLFQSVLSTTHAISLRVLKGAKEVKKNNYGTKMFP